LCLQQTTCPAGQTTSISGVVYAPNGTDPLPDVLVYIPNAPVAAFTPGVSCPVVGQPPSGSPLVGATTAVDGSFEITNVPVGTNIPLVIQTGRWRRQLVVPTTTACSNTVFSAQMPQNQTQGDIPKFAIATGSADQVECVLRKVGIQDSEFTDWPDQHLPGQRLAGGECRRGDAFRKPADGYGGDAELLRCADAALRGRRVWPVGDAAGQPDRVRECGRAHLFEPLQLCVDV
jgi:hypothetical protein